MPRAPFSPLPPRDFSKGSNFQVFLTRQRASGLGSGAFSNSVFRHRPLILTGARAAFDSIHALRRDAKGKRRRRYH